MENNNLLNRYLPLLREKALNSTLHTKLSACLINKQKMISKPQCNINSTICRGNICSSIHAEAHVLLIHYGKNLVFDKNRWYLLRKKRKLYKKS